MFFCCFCRRRRRRRHHQPSIVCCQFYVILVVNLNQAKSSQCEWKINFAPASPRSHVAWTRFVQQVDVSTVRICFGRFDVRAVVPWLAHTAVTLRRCMILVFTFKLSAKSTNRQDCASVYSIKANVLALYCTAYAYSFTRLWLHEF